jgi:hypothetical protein
MTEDTTERIKGKPQNRGNSIPMETFCIAKSFMGFLPIFFILWSCGPAGWGRQEGSIRISR